MPHVAVPGLRSRMTSSMALCQLVGDERGTGGTGKIVAQLFWDIQLMTSLRQLGFLVNLKG